MKWHKMLLIIIALLSLSVCPAFAFEGRGGEKVVIEKGEVVEDDLFIGAREFILRGTVKGDLIVFAEEIKIEETGVVEGDLYTAGKTIEVKGKVVDDIIGAGYALSVSGEGGSDFIGAGFSAEAAGKLGQDFLFFGYQALVAGDVGRNLRFAGNGIKITGRIGGNAEVDVSGAEEKGLPPEFFELPDLPPVPQVSPGLTIQKGAYIGGNLRYTAGEEASIPEGVVKGKVEFKKYEPPEKVVPPPHVRAMRWGLERLRYFVSLLAVGALMLLVAPSWTRGLADAIRAKPLPSFGWGIVVLVVFGVLLALLAVITVVVSLFFRFLTLEGLASSSFFTGLIAGVTGFWGMRLAWIYVTRVLASIALGAAIFQVFRSQAAGSRWWPFILGTAILVLVTSIPILGAFLAWIASFAGLGAFWLWATAKPEEVSPPS